MSSLSQNIGQAISDFDSIKQAITDKGVEVGNVPTSEYANKIGQIQTGQELYFATSGKCYPSNLVLSNDVTMLADYIYSDCTNLTNVATSSSVKIIGKYAFRNCKNLVNVAIANGVTEVGAEAFRNCTSLKSIVIPNSVTSWGANVLLSCSSLESVILEKGFNCTGLNLSITNKLTASCMVAMFEALADLTGQEAKTLTLGATNLAKLTDEQKQIATNKNWNLA